jgi:heme-degrading monooxygenase HmoA
MVICEESASIALASAQAVIDLGAKGSNLMMVVVFRARRTPEGVGDEYKRQLARMSDLARKMPGYISHKPYIAEDGERLTLFEWESAETLRAWATHPEHVPVQELGRQKFYTEYHLQVCEVVRESRFTRSGKESRTI